jgi:hypothetical protein
MRDTPENLMRKAKIVEVSVAGQEAALRKKPPNDKKGRKASAGKKNGEAAGRKHADVLIDIVEGAELFHTPDGAGYVDLEIAGHRETWSLRSKGFRRWLARRFFEDTGGAPNSEAMQSALNVIEAISLFDSPERQAHVRVGGLNGRMYLDLCDEKWRAVEIDANGWRLIDRPPMRFRRAAGMRALPIPVSGGSGGR